MKVGGLVLVATLALVPLHGQPGVRRPSPDALSFPTAGLISVGADRSGRKALCDELTQSRVDEANKIRLVPEDGELRCLGPRVDRVELRFEAEPNDASNVICQFANQPAPLLFEAMKIRPIAIRSGAAPSDPFELQLTLGRLGARTLGRVLEAFGFETVTARSTRPAEPFDQIGVHELEIACRSE